MVPIFGIQSRGISSLANSGMTWAINFDETMLFSRHENGDAHHTKLLPITSDPHIDFYVQHCTDFKSQILCPKKSTRTTVHICFLAGNKACSAGCVGQNTSIHRTGWLILDHRSAHRICWRCHRNLWSVRQIVYPASQIIAQANSAHSDAIGSDWMSPKLGTSGPKLLQT
jgi:hypothetical protein